jgi:hypothetical protein
MMYWATIGVVANMLIHAIPCYVHGSEFGCAVGHEWHTHSGKLRAGASRDCILPSRRSTSLTITNTTGHQEGLPLLRFCEDPIEALLQYRRWLRETGFPQLPSAR